jgi:muramidase (phage lysozyme)
MIEIKTDPNHRIVELGGGDRPRSRPNVDCRPGPSVDEVADFNKPLPFKDGEFDGAFSQYALEHVSWRNVRAFLKLIRKGESGLGQDAYRMIVGGGYFNGFADHPRIKRDVSSAAGAYQITATTWDDLRKTYPLPDFSPASQDAAAVVLIKRRRALADVVDGKWESAIYKLRNEWTSLPGAKEQRYSMADAKRFLLAQGGIGADEGVTA